MHMNGKQNKYEVNFQVKDWDYLNGILDLTTQNFGDLAFEEGHWDLEGTDWGRMTASINDARARKKLESEDRVSLGVDLEAWALILEILTHAAEKEGDDKSQAIAVHIQNTLALHRQVELPRQEIRWR